MYRRRVLKKTRRRGKCLFCEKKLVPDYKEPEYLTRFLTERGKIVAKDRSSCCAKHQRKLAQAIKRGRYLALLQ